MSPISKNFFTNSQTLDDIIPIISPSKDTLKKTQSQRKIIIKSPREVENTLISTTEKKIKKNSASNDNRLVRFANDEDTIEITENKTSELFSNLLRKQQDILTELENNYKTKNTPKNDTKVTNQNTLLATIKNMVDVANTKFQTIEKNGKLDDKAKKIINQTKMKLVNLCNKLDLKNIDNFNDKAQKILNDCEDKILNLNNSKDNDLAHFYDYESFLKEFEKPFKEKFNELTKIKEELVLKNNKDIEEIDNQIVAICEILNPNYTEVPDDQKIIQEKKLDLERLSKELDIPFSFHGETQHILNEDIKTQFIDYKSFIKAFGDATERKFNELTTLKEKISSQNDKDIKEIYYQIDELNEILTYNLPDPKKLSPTELFDCVTNLKEKKLQIARRAKDLGIITSSGMDILEPKVKRTVYKNILVKAYKNSKPGEQRTALHYLIKIKPDILKAPDNNHTYIHKQKIKLINKTEEKIVSLTKKNLTPSKLSTKLDSITKDIELKMDILSKEELERNKELKGYNEAKFKHKCYLNEFKIALESKEAELTKALTANQSEELFAKILHLNDIVNKYLNPDNKNTTIPYVAEFQLFNNLIADFKTNINGMRVLKLHLALAASEIGVTTSDGNEIIKQRKKIEAEDAIQGLQDGGIKI